VITTSTAILLAVIVLSAVAVYFSSTNRSPALLWSALAVSLAVAIALLVVLKAGLVPITPINFSIIVLGIINFGVVESMRIYRRLSSSE
jgi:uncharacterized membrane protein